MAEQRYAVFSSREIIAEQVIDLNAEYTWGELELIKKRQLEKIVTGLVGSMLEVIREFYAGLPSELTNTSNDKVKIIRSTFGAAQGVPNAAGKFHLIQLGTAGAP
ncbi:hypothetical protein IGI04_015434 [Brassica rapa subsp. trilocularis]|uniref:Uncharacterized protein n=2 Tax=Brassica campestris TaxID=3711 RepID=M4EHG2_BRACM|nr:hypothetical protein IGI04_015434 [Brassica rapa subsp. trilocularis]VDD12228.1 unnamed protein product [Brassica rapa]